jgi:ADP-ribose pyrophosphatase YjhB (NUDIX family)
MGMRPDEYLQASNPRTCFQHSKALARAGQPEAGTFGARFCSLTRNATGVRIVYAFAPTPDSLSPGRRMAISPYVKQIRARVGSSRLLLPSVAALVHTDAGGLLLVRQRDGGVWSTPGGTIEPDETPSDAVVRETWEEAGLWVEPRRIASVLGGPEFIVRYPNGDESQYIIIAFQCVVRTGHLRPDGEETLEARFCSEGEAATLPLAPWLRLVLSTFYALPDHAAFELPLWQPPMG